MSDEKKATPAVNDTTLQDQMFDLGNRVGRSVIAVIDTMTQRGGFRGEELSTIGQLRDQAVQMVQLAEAYHSQEDVK